MSIKNICFCKLKSGEEFIAEIVEQTDSDLLVKNAAIVVPHPDNQQSMMLVPWNPYNFIATDTIPMPIDIFAFVQPVQEKIEMAHIQTYSNIQLATAADIPQKGKLLLTD